jgi:ribosomal protein S18 acetylase RimI-like enzyme
MQIHSLGRRTDLIFARFSGSVSNKDSYTLIQTPSNPGYHWGNFIIFDHAPGVGSLKNWTEIFDREFSYYSEPHHYVFTWDTGHTEPGEIQEFLDAGFEFDSATVLATSELSHPPHFNQKIEIRKIIADHDWAEVVKLQTLCADPKYLNSYYETFKKTQMDSYRKMSTSGLGHWYGAFLENNLVGNLGIFHDGKIARYQSVGTHPDFRGQGICGTLVHAAGMIAMNEYDVRQLVMEADVNYHAARIYESVGFKRCEVNHALSWWNRKSVNG